MPARAASLRDLDVNGGNKGGVDGVLVDSADQAGGRIYGDQLNACGAGGNHRCAAAVFVDGLRQADVTITCGGFGSCLSVHLRSGNHDRTSTGEPHPTSPRAVRDRRAGTQLSAVFLDRDGVINRKAAEGDYVPAWKAFEFLPGALEGLRLLARSELTVIVVTNQRGVALGRIAPQALAEIHRKMRAAVVAAGAQIDAIYCCPHDAGCHCRKPEVGLFEQAARDFRLTLMDTAVIGDQSSDMIAARRVVLSVS